MRAIKAQAAPPAPQPTCMGGGSSRPGGAGIGGGGSSTGGGLSGSGHGGGGLPGGFGLPGCCARPSGKRPTIFASDHMKQKKKDDDGDRDPKKPQKDRHELHSSSDSRHLGNKRGTGAIPHRCSDSGKEL
jgi:hypothetical protein